MINSEKGTVKLEGSARELYADLGCISHSLKLVFEGEGMPKDEVVRFLADAFNNGIEEDLGGTEEVNEKIALSPIARLIAEIDKRLKGGS